MHRDIELIMIIVIELKIHSSIVKIFKAVLTEIPTMNKKQSN